ncbi:MAG: V-type ATPase subunit [Candidatus Thermoplasmatota archaeon]|nr:V-type ATPase subunit [Candidatus Thermoplasmatota archaeon]MBS3790661.1 V-type ATPase subunit [Candidatus Thermoplasmatota archaeon]
MLEEFIDNIGMTNFVFLIIGLALLLVIILFMSYYRVVISIANFTYPNAVFRSSGNPYLKEKKISNLVEGGNLNEVYSELEEDGYEISKEAREDIDKVEKELEKKNIELMKKANRTSPDETKRFTKAWLSRYDVKMAKRAIKAIKEDRLEEVEERLYPVREINEKVIDDLSSARNLQEAISILRDTKLEEVLEKKEWEEKPFELDVTLDKYAFNKLKEGIFKVESEQRAPVRYFFGRYVDLLNIKIILRGIREEIQSERLKDCILPKGRELPEWKLEEMAESTSIDEALVQLEGTSYEDIRNKMQSDEKFDFEHYLDKKLLKMVTELNNQHILTVGPTLKYIVGKELELRNIRALIRGIKEDIDPMRVKELMILEDNI